MAQGEAATRGAPSLPAPGGAPTTIQVGILTKGKPTLGMVLASLLLQDSGDMSIHIVDTSDEPVVKRNDVTFALRLAFDRGIRCGYEYSRERKRAFSLGRLKLLEALAGPNVCFVDDDVVMPSTSIGRMLGWIEAAGTYGYVAPFCRNSPLLGGPTSSLRYAPGAVFHQDAVVRRILLDYYGNSTDLLDKDISRPKVWEIAFLTAVFPLLGRRCIVQSDNVIYHLDYHERPSWELEQPEVAARSVARARELAEKYLAPGTPP